MIQIGKLSKRGPVGQERYSRFTEDEQYTHMTFWSIYRSPLMIGGNLPENRELELKLFTNAEVLAVTNKAKTLNSFIKKMAQWFGTRMCRAAKIYTWHCLTLGDANKSVAVDFAAAWP
jgi:alpha-galactosidase